MSDKRKAVMAALMLTMMIGQTVAIPLIIPIAIGFAASSVFGYWLGILDSENYQELIQQYDAQLTSNTIQNDINTRLYLQEIYARDNNIINLGQDLLKYSENYAWALAKYEALKVIDYELTQNGTNFTYAKTLAKQKAHDAVRKYYLNLTRNVIVLANESAELLNYSLNDYVERIQITPIVVNFEAWYYDPNNSGGSHGEANATVNYSSSSPVISDYQVISWRYSVTSMSIYQTPVFYTGTESVSAVGQTFDVKRLRASFKVVYDYGAQSYTQNIWVKQIWMGGSEQIYNNSVYMSLISQIDSEYNMINANIDAYIDGLAQDYVANWNVTQLIDPYILAGLLNQDLNNTGYHGYAAAELALLGLNTTGINKTISITVYDDNGNATVMEGWLFTDWMGTLETGQNYTADSNYKWFFVSDGGLYDLTGYNFTVGTIRDWQGNELTNVTLTRYISHTGDVLKMYDELAQIRQLYEEYINNLQAMAAGGSGGGFSLSEWWASLDQAAKIGVIAIGAVGVYAILGRRR